MTIWNPPRRIAATLLVAMMVLVVVVACEGPPGPQGERGAQGEAGQGGQQGERGPQGEQGLIGPAGEQGPRGPQGEQGLTTGIPGPQGGQGIQGERGEQGEVGPQGQGAPGPQGVRGPHGLQGETGPQGERGPQGSQGEPGPIGPAGPKGDRGQSAPQDYYWSVERVQDLVSNEWTAVLTTEARWNPSNYRIPPFLEIVCASDGHEVRVNYIDYIAVQRSSAPVDGLTKWDNDPAVNVRWQTANSQPEYAPDFYNVTEHPTPKDFIRRSEESDEVYVRVGNITREARFDVRGLGRHLDAHADLCR